MSEFILPDGARWLTESMLDPTGRVFLHEGEIYRAVRASAAERVRRFFDKGIAATLVEKGLLVPVEIGGPAVGGAALVLRHKRVPFLTAAHEWCRPLLRDAALVWLDLNLALAPHGLATVDAHWGNFGQLGCCRPTWIDFGSIAELTAGDQGISEFHTYFRNPLRLAARSSGLSRIARGMLQTGGLNDNEAESMNFAAVPGGRQLHYALSRGRVFWKKKIARTRKVAPGIASRESLLQREREELAAIDFPKMKTTWGDYHPDLLFADKIPDLFGDPRRAAILRAIESIRPRRAIDLAGNAGFYGFYTARLGAEVLATDFDETACERLYEFARTVTEPLSVTTACYDVTRPPFERPLLPRRADLVLALALTHHLTLGQGFSFAFVVETLARYTTDALLVEYMPAGLGGTAPKPDPLPEWYAREIFEAELRARFTHVELLNESKLPQWRALYLARGKR